MTRIHEFNVHNVHFKKDINYSDTYLKSMTMELGIDTCFSKILLSGRCISFAF